MAVLTQNHDSAATNSRQADSEPRAFFSDSRAEGASVGFVVGLPRSGTTLLTFLLAGSSDSLSLSEPYLARTIFSPWRVRRFFKKIRFRDPKPSARPPAAATNDQFLEFMRSLAESHGLRRVLIKETYRCSREWRNTDLMEWIAGTRRPVAAVMRHPYDVAVSSIRFCRWWRGLTGMAMRWIAPGLPLFRDDGEVVAHVAENWVSFCGWCEQHQVPVARYEDLVVRPEDELKRICVRLQVPFEPRMLDAAEPRSAFGGIGDPMVMKQCGRPVKQSSVGRKKELSPAQQEIISGVCAAAAGRYGYEL